MKPWSPVKMCRQFRLCLQKWKGELQRYMYHDLSKHYCINLWNSICLPSSWLLNECVNFLFALKKKHFSEEGLRNLEMRLFAWTHNVTSKITPINCLFAALSRFLSCFWKQNNDKNTQGSNHTPSGNFTQKAVWDGWHTSLQLFCMGDSCSKRYSVECPVSHRQQQQLDSILTQGYMHFQNCAQIVWAPRTELDIFQGLLWIKMLGLHLTLY